MSADKENNPRLPCKMETRHLKNLDPSSMTGEQKNYVAYMVLDKCMTPSERLDKFPNISKTAINRWVKNVREGISNLSVGRPSDFSLDEKEKLTAVLIKKHVHDQDAATQKDFVDLATEGKKNTAAARGRVPGNGGSVSSSSLKRLKHDINAKNRASEHQSNARAAAVADPRNNFSQHCLLTAVEGEPNFCGNRMFNFDATQFKISSDAKGNCVVVINEETKDIPVKIKSGGGLDQAIKVMFTASGSGFIGPLVFVVADPAMKKGEMKWMKIKGLGAADGCNRVYSYLVISQKRTSDLAFFEHFYNDVLIPFVNHLRDEYCVRNDDGTPMTASVVCDGEHDQVHGIIEDSSLLKSLEDHCIIMSKSPASSCRSHQPPQVHLSKNLIVEISSNLANPKSRVSPTTK